ncbi:hypothetical protein EOD42_21095 [Rhodovarius crocodyli]|uniref:Uncharacterized protein n=1 Tax=Rhodovarius crocodyli TaxID=1979269 RepID=A0A437M2S2_9PROT|nr:hypothetical protein [Rhodovarius crocodyli]RVT91814.1 hypothetical protein EOD42_21095 [Rhodovarius crocodyli]
MKNIVRVSLVAAAVAIVGFTGNARAEGEYVNDYPRVTSNNLVGGGPVLVLNTGNSGMPTETRALSNVPLHAQAEPGPAVQAAHSPATLGSQSAGG